MTDPASPAPEGSDLGESFASLVGGQIWEVDAPELLNEPVAEEPPPVEEPPAPVPVAVIEPAPVVEERPPSPQQIIEAMLFIGGAPLRPERACEVIRGLDHTQFVHCIDQLNILYRRQNRPYSITVSDLGYTLTIRPKYRTVRDKLLGSPREARLSQPALDVLAVVAYRQPITKAEVDGFRGSDSGAILRQLVRLGLIAVVRRGEAAQTGVSYGTTARFLELFNLRSLDELPQTGDVQRL